MIKAYVLTNLKNASLWLFKKTHGYEISNLLTSSNNIRNKSVNVLVIINILNGLFNGSEK